MPWIWAHVTIDRSAGAPDLISCSACPRSITCTTRCSVELRVCGALNSQPAEHLAYMRRVIAGEAHIGVGQLLQLIDCGGARLPDCRVHGLRQLVETMLGDRRQQRLLVGKVTVGRGMAHSSRTRDLAQIQAGNSFLCQ